MKTKIFYLILFTFLTQTLFAQNQKLTPEEFEKKLKAEKEYQLVDVRTLKEYKEGHIKDALNIDYNSSEFQRLVDQLDKEKPTYVYCFVGPRSTAAIKYMESKGFKNIYELNGGMKKWKETGKPFDSEIEKSEGLSKAEYDKIISSENLVLVDFGAKWCGPCRKMAPSIDRLSKDQSLKTKVLKIDTDQNEILARDLNIEVLPTLYLYKNKKLVWQQEGFMTEEDLRKVIAKHSN